MYEIFPYNCFEIHPKIRPNGSHRPSSRGILETITSQNSTQVDNFQKRTPTFVLNSADVICKIFYRKLKGIFQYCDGLKMTRFEMAQSAGDILVG